MKRTTRDCRLGTAVLESWKTRSIANERVNEHEISRLQEYLGKALRVIRYKRRMSQVTAVRKLAEVGVDVTQSWLSRLETGKTRLGPRELGHLCSLYQVRPRTVFEVADDVAIVDRMDEPVALTELVRRLSRAEPAKMRRRRDSRM